MVMTKYLFDMVVYSRDEISFWDDWYTVVMTGHRKTQSAASDCVCGPFVTSMQHHHQHHYHINNNDNYYCYVFEFFFIFALSIIGITAGHHHKTICFRIPVLIHPWTTPLDIGEVSQNRNPSSKKMSHLHSRTYIFHQRNMSFSS